MKTPLPARTLFGVSLTALAIFGAPLAHADILFNVDTVADLVDADTSDGLCRMSAGNCS